MAGWWKIKKEYWIVIFTQVVYVVIALVVALILWTCLPEVNEAIFSIGPFRGGGAFAGLVFVWWFLHKTGPINVAKLAAGRLIHADVIMAPSKKEEYDALFDGIEDGDYYAFNAPFKLEGDPKDRLFEDALKTHEKRYLEGGVTSHYLFFDKPSYDRAKTFFQRLANRIGKDVVEERIRIVNWKDPPEVPDYTFFVGYKGKNKGKKPFCIFYPSATMGEGLPHAIIYIEGAGNLLKILTRHFKEKRDQATQ